MTDREQRTSAQVAPVAPSQAAALGTTESAPERTPPATEHHRASGGRTSVRPLRERAYAAALAAAQDVPAPTLREVVDVVCDVYEPVVAALVDFDERLSAVVDEGP